MRALIVLLAFLLPSTVVAQATSASRLHKYADPGKEQADKVMEEYASCMTARGYSHDVLSTLPTSPGEAELLERINDKTDNCLFGNKTRMWNREIRFSSASLRGELARAFLKSELDEKNQDSRDGHAMASLSQRVGSASNYDRSVVVLHQFAACLADEQFEESIAFATSRKGSAEEGEAIKTLAPYFSECFADGASIELTRPLLKLVLAEAVYHNLTFQPESNS